MGGSRKPTSARPTLADRSGAVRAILAITVVLSACSLLYELLIAQTLSLLAGNTVVWYSLTVGAYLGAMGLGAMLVDTRAARSAWNTLFIVEVLLSIVGALAVLMIQLAHEHPLHRRSPSEHRGRVGGPHDPARPRTPSSSSKSF